jgi:Rps23 Pro-64 3,4-dihydroxylase Tpa1-like proline 4-hydroxylase
VRHLDAPGDNEAGGQRRLTLLYYINPDWSPADGGCLRLYPKTQVPMASQEEEEEVFVDVEPVGDRLLIFQSRTIEHEVLPSQALRFSLTLWLY